MRNTIAPDLPPVRGDMGRIVQILFNLLSNSCKFTERGHITLSATLEGDRIRVSVEDSGIGIPEARFNQVFQAFEQVGRAQRRQRRRWLPTACAVTGRPHCLHMCAAALCSHISDELVCPLGSGPLL